MESPSYSRDYNLIELLVVVEARGNIKVALLIQINCDKVDRSRAKII